MPVLTGILALTALALLLNTLAGCGLAGGPAPTPTKTRSVALAAIRRATLVQATRVTYTPSPTGPPRQRPTARPTAPSPPGPTLPAAAPAPLPSVTADGLPAPTLAPPPAFNTAPGSAPAAPRLAATATPTAAPSVTQPPAGMPLPGTGDTPAPAATTLALPDAPRFYVYMDGDAAENHFAPAPVMGEVQDVAVDLNHAGSPCPGSGSSDIQITYHPSDPTKTAAMVALQWLETHNPSAGVNLSHYVRLAFCARGEVGGELVTFGMGGNGRDAANCAALEPFADSSCRVARDITLTAHWQEYAIDLSSTDLTRVIDGFFWEVRPDRNPAGATFYVDDIRYEHR